MTFTRRRRCPRTLPLTTALCALALSHGLAQQPSGVPSQPDDRTIVHVLNRIGFGAAPGDVEKVRRVGLHAFIDQQLQPERMPDAAMTPRLAGLATLRMSTRELADTYYVPALMERQRRQRESRSAGPGAPGAAEPARRGDARHPQQVLGELMEQKLLRAIYSDRQLEEVLVDFWFNHFNVFAGKGPTRMYLVEYERDVIRPHALGRFRELLGATAKSPAMLFYLDNWRSAAPEDARTADQARGRGGARMTRAARRPGRPGAPALQRPRNAPRGLNENYARELMELHTLGVEGGYTQKDVQQVARAFTGWTIVQPRMGGGFRYEPRMHDDGEKVVLGHRIKPGGGMKDGEEVLDLLARHPSTARFIATKLARRFVADEPPAEVVDRAARRFTDTGGDIREVVRVIVTSPEFFAPAAYRAKMKTPLEFVASAVRATGVELPTASPMAQALRELGMPLYMCQPPTGYADQAEAWVNAGALLNRMNFAVALTSGRAGGAARARQAGRHQRRHERGAIGVSADDVIRHALAGDLSDATRSTIARAADTRQALALVLGSPDFQKR